MIQFIVLKLTSDLVHGEDLVKKIREPVKESKYYC